MAVSGGDAGAWTERFEQDCTALVQALLALPAGGRRGPWRDLMSHVGPHLERWAEQSFVLRTCRLSTPDDARTVLVNMLERLQANDFANLRRFVERLEPGEASDRADTATLSCIVKLAAENDDVQAASRSARDGRTPLRAWLLTLLSYTVKDHVRDRLGWKKKTDDESAAGGSGSKRDVNTHATRLDDHDEAGERPPITDLLTMQRFLEQAIAFIETFPPDMERATKLWLDDEPIDDIAGALATSAPQVTSLIRAAKARLREQFRGDWDQLRGIGA